jgi:Peptidase A4 family
MKNAVLGNGIKVRTFTAPPAGFDPVTAPASALAAHGFPPRPKNPKALASYTKFFSQLKNRLSYVEPSFQVGPRPARVKPHPARVKPPLPTVSPALAEFNPSWSGSQAAAPSQEAFLWNSAQWTVPNISSPPVGGGYAWSWIGLSSFDVNTLGLFQAGVASNVEGTGSGSSRSFQFFVEFFPDNALLIDNLPVSPGDTVGAFVFTDGANATSGSYVLANLTSGAATSGFVSQSQGLGLGASDQALWIVEQPSVDGTATVLADYTQLFFSGCEALSSGEGVDLVGGGTGTAIDMVAADGTTVVSDGVLVTDTVVQCVYTGPRIW